MKSLEKMTKAELRDVVLTQTRQLAACREQLSLANAPRVPQAVVTPDHIRRYFDAHPGAKSAPAPIVRAWLAANTH